MMSFPPEKRLKGPFPKRNLVIIAARSAEAKYDTENDVPRVFV